MSKYRLICPECSAALITTYPEAAVWELCPACRRHMWDINDARMADVLPESQENRHAKRFIEPVN